jgi:aquaporin Z
MAASGAPTAAAATTALRQHWPEYLMEALGLGLFMISACAFATLLEHPASPVRHALPASGVRRALMGLAMGLTAIGLVYSPWGRRSGAHMNPALTLAFTRLGHVRRWDAVFYALAQFVGGVAGVALMARVLGAWLADPAVNFVVTRPGPGGPVPALAAELAMSFALMSLVIVSTTRKRLMPWTGVLAGTMVALWITLEAPVSGMSMNPARTFASAAVSGQWRGWWVYFVAPPLGMLAAAEVSRFLGSARAGCAKLHHPDWVRCIFCGQSGVPRRDRQAAAPEQASELSARDLVSPSATPRTSHPIAGTFPSAPALRAGSRKP